MADRGTTAGIDRAAGTAAELELKDQNPVRAKWLPYGRQSISDEDIAAVIAVLKGDWLTQGPTVEAFEKAVAKRVGAQYAVAVNSGTAALHAAYFAAGIGPGDEIITTGMTFAATANAALYLGATARFADVEPDTGNIDVRSIERLITKNTKAIAPIDYGGHPCEFDELKAIAKRHGLYLIEDAAHSIGATYRDQPIGSVADLATFSFHPVKTITTGEGGMVVTNDAKLAERLRLFRTHGIEKRPELLENYEGAWFHEMQELGFNYRLTDFQCALGLSQLHRIDEFITRRRDIAKRYRELLAPVSGVTPLDERSYVKGAYHLFPLLIGDGKDGTARAKMFKQLHANNIGVQVHYIPVYHHPYYRKLFGDLAAQCPNTETFYNRVLSLPMFPAMSNDDVDDVVTAIKKVLPYCIE
jgi:perosamine synthetase